MVGWLDELYPPEEFTALLLIASLVKTLQSFALGTQAHAAKCWQHQSEVELQYGFACDAVERKSPKVMDTNKSAFLIFPPV